MSITVRVMNFVSKQRRSTIWLMALAFVLGLGAVDYVTGTKISLTFFYLLPISLASWSLGRNPGRFVALLSALVIQAALFSSEIGEGLALMFWNLAVRLAVVVFVADLVAEFRHLLKHQTELSRTDALTGSLNRRAFQEAGDVVLERMQRAPNPLTVAFLDIDNFKAVNDASGHAVGDALLVRVAECLRSRLWGTDTVARLGGDEFGILLPHTGPAAAQKVMPRLREHLLHEMQREHWPVTFSIGVVTSLTPPPDTEHLVHLADELMYAAKRGGKNRIEYAVYPSMLTVAQEPCDEEPEHAARAQAPQPQ